MPEIKLGRLEKLDLRSVWTNKAGDFTPWLASEENLKLLGNTIGLELDLEAREKNVGPFRADILCKDTESSSWVLIESQLERTDHSHLGQLLTYAAGLEAATIVWVAERFTEEPSHVMMHPVGRSGFWLNSVASVWDSSANAKTPEVRVDFVIGEVRAKQYFDALERQKDEIERELGFPLVWHNPANARMCRVYVRRPGDFTKEQDWPALHEWLRKNLELFHKVFSERVKKLTAAAAADEGSDDGSA